MFNDTAHKSRQKLGHWLSRPYGIEPLVTFRILFGALMMVGALRFMQKGWIERLYIEPVLHFKFYGFEWVEALSPAGMYVLYTLIAVSAGLIMVGLFYRLAAVVFFLTFTYSELIDATNYLNHYYLVCLLALLLCFLPAHRTFSLDVKRRPALRRTHIPAWTVYLLMFQIGVVYFFAGFAKLNADWLFRAMPLAVWLPGKADMPLIGPLLQPYWIAFVFSWFGALYDLTIAFFLLNSRTRPFAYAAVVVFHVLTKLLFNIGLFPFIMIFNTLIFFPPAFHRRLLGKIGYRSTADESIYHFPKTPFRLLKPALYGYIVFQLLFPLRYLLYPGPILWTEEGYRFAWRVMLVEKTGQAVFHVRDGESGRRTEIDNTDYLTLFQEKQVAIQPDFMLQYARFLADTYENEFGFKNPIVTVDSYVALNGRSSLRYIDPNINLAALRDGWRTKKWIIKYQKE